MSPSHLFVSECRADHAPPHAGKRPRGGGIVVAGDDLLQLRRKGHAERLVRLLPLVVQRAATDILLTQIAYIDERHAPCVETEQEHIASLVQFAVPEITGGEDTQQTAVDGQFRGSGGLERHVRKRVPGGWGLQPYTRARL